MAPIPDEVLKLSGYLGPGIDIGQAMTAQTLTYQQTDHRPQMK